jgi:hypothetical protein
MELIGTAVNAGVVAAIGLALAWVMKGRFEAVDKRFDAIDGRLDAHDQRMDRMEERFEQRLDGRFSTLQASIDAMRSDITRVALAVGVQEDSA